MNDMNWRQYVFVALAAVLMIAGLLALIGLGAWVGVLGMS
jgi:hypothetical protein